MELEGSMPYKNANVLLNLFYIAILYEIFALLRCFAARIASYLATFRHNISVPGPIYCLETSLNNHQSTQRNIQEEPMSYLHLDGSLKSRIFYDIDDFDD
jgi:hypothetical protein